MAKAILTAVFVVLALIGLILAVDDNLATGLAAAPATAPAAAAPTVLTGTIDYYPNNTGADIPYLVYRAHGGVATKALVFLSGSRCEAESGSYPCALIADALPAYFGAGPVTVEGEVEAAGFIVSSLSPA